MLLIMWRVDIYFLIITQIYLAVLKFIILNGTKQFFYRLFQAFVEKFSRDLSLECAHLGVTVQCVLPGFVATNMSRFKSSLTVPSPTQFVRGHMNTLGLECSSPGYWVHKIQVTGELFYRSSPVTDSFSHLLTDWTVPLGPDVR